MTTTHSLATMIHEAQRAVHATSDALTPYLNDEPGAAEPTSAEMTAFNAANATLRRLLSLRTLCRRACGLARAGDSVVLVAPVGTSPDEVAGGLADEGAGRERVEVLTPSAEEWPAVFAAARQRSGVEVVS